ncbi:nucleotide phosphodiesterase [Scheffersomyces stipitis CBS 6054]|uniref:Phosphodiesterase n=1 Tax=Scheffersomyces stipitis (strain ATCC 58785 / CBS 6054 / NBRC 10063 / NRRL Y-11545) TaxID=322104 RepID=A3LX23_PICST|nr:nucleotide phosphodiesterase [Scheffersomyces stipitis CBS 6054]ABN67390.2 nucleotide phosphodiesterase [Scheffersomyces stipitis CBS 6054]
MAEILSLVPDTPGARAFNLHHRSFKYYQNFRDIVAYLFSKGNNEADTNYPIVVVVDETEGGTSTATSLHELSFSDKKLVLKYFFIHQNIIIVSPRDLNPDYINNKITQVTNLITNRISRVETWTGTGTNSINDFYSQEEDLELGEVISTMSFLLSNNTNKSSQTTEHIIYLKDLIIADIDFKSLLSNHTPEHLARLCHAVGHWAFPAHELSNDDLVYCVFLMFKYALKQVKKNHSGSLLHIPTSNELLAFVFMVRDTYKNGNPFHNFRHAVDVLQACFHFLIRLDCLPVFKQLKNDPKSDELAFLQTNSIILHISPAHSPNHLNHLQTLGLLVAALGHDVGHPGVTNAFMIKNFAPTSILFNDRSVLESFHSSVFINKILAVNWPSLLTVFTESGESVSGLSLREIIISSILATDMAEHFEYIDRLKNLKSHDFIKHNNRVKLISSLLIKCADISNVTRPLRVSSQWAMVLGREFDEVAMLEKKITSEDHLGDLDTAKDLTYTKVPLSLNEILKSTPNLHKGQIFFINTFAENLFSNIAELLPELKYTCDIIRENKEFWVNRDKA